MRILLAIALTAGLAGPALADALEDLRAGDNAFRQRKYQEALGHYTRGITDPGNAFNERLTKGKLAELYYSRADTYRRLGRNREAIGDYRRSISLNPGYYQAHYNMGNAHASLKQLREAIEAYNAAIRIKSDFAPAYVNRGNRYAQLKQYRRAIQDYDRAIQLKPDVAIAWHNRGLIHEILKERSKAIRDYRRALEIRPSYEKARRALRRLGAL